MRIKQRAAIAEGLEQDLSGAFSDEAIAALSSAQFEPACIQQDSGIPSRPGGTACMIKESGSSVSDGSAGDTPAVQ